MKTAPVAFIIFLFSLPAMGAVCAAEASGTKLTELSIVPASDINSVNLLRRAEDFIKLKDYPRALEYLEDLLKKDPSALIQGEERFEPAWKHCLELINKLPENVKALYAARAGGRLMACVDNGGVGRGDLLSVVIPALPARVGSEQALKLARDFIEKGDYGAARMVLEALLEYGVRDENLLLDARFYLFEACALSGEKLKLAKLVDAPDIKQFGGEPRLAKVLGYYHNLAINPEPVNGEDAKGRGALDGGWERGGGHVLWHHNIPCDLPLPSKATGNYTKFIKEAEIEGVGILWSKHHFPTANLAVSGRRVYYSGLPELYCFDIASGNVLWSSGAVEKKGNAVAYFDDGGDKSFPSPSSAWHFTSHVGRDLCLAGRAVVRVEHSLPVMEYGNSKSAVNERRKLNDRLNDGDFPHTNVLAAYDASDGRGLWKIDGDGFSPSVRFAGAPVAADGALVCVVEEMRKVWAWGIDPASGKVLWRSVIGKPRTMFSTMPVAPGLAAAFGRVYILRGDGLLFCLETNTGGILWASRYPLVAMKKYGPFTLRNTVAAVGDKVVIMPIDSDLVAVFGDDGKLLHHFHNKYDKYIVASRGGDLILGGVNQIRRMRLDDGRNLWTAKIPEVSGRAVLSGKIYAPTNEGIAVIDPDKGKVEKKLDAKGVRTEALPFLGNLHVGDGLVLTAGGGRVRALTSAADILEKVKAMIADSGGYQLRVQLASLLLELGRNEEAAAVLKKTLAAFDSPGQDKLFAEYLSKLTERKLAEIKKERKGEDLRGAYFLYRKELEKMLELSGKTEGAK